MPAKIFWEVETKGKQANQQDAATSFELAWSFFYSWTRIWKQGCSQWAEMGPPAKRSALFCSCVRRTPEHPVP